MEDVFGHYLGKLGKSCNVFSESAADNLDKGTLAEFYVEECWEKVISRDET